ncbi:MAG TPA: serine hydrolase domain-containing protein [Steroidobacteraceae bacterium]|jgi:CubicO group peptidase (beta-lactamase class C family)|nr:serine hydrolase domain-containing protein [Steroidobacteraceae bacterium]
MRTLITAFLLVLCGAAQAEKLSADTPKTTTLGNTFIAPAGWSVAVRGPATIVEAPEGDSRIVIVDVRAKDADAALAAGWAAYQPPKWPLKVTNDVPDKDGWSKQRNYTYQTSPNERRDVGAGVSFANDVWTVVIYDMAQAVGEKRGAQVALIFDKLLPKGYSRETFAGKKAQRLDAARIAKLTKFLEDGAKATGVPGVSLGLIQDGKVVFSGGVGVRELGGSTKVDGDTLYMIASNTKGLTTLLLAKLVDAGKITWKTPVTQLLPEFKLGNADTTQRVLVEHLICACTGLPRQDMEWLFQFKGVTPEGALATLATVQPTSRFGEMFQYSNLLAGAAGFTAGHVLYPQLEIGAAYDKAMQTEVFDPLGMKATTFDYARALSGNHSNAHAPDVDGKPARAVFELNYSIIPLRPAGAAWSSVNDMLKYVSMELANGALPDGSRYISKGPLLERREAKVPVGKDAVYGMGLMVDSTYAVPVVHHGGDMVGFHSDMLWLPEQQVGAVVLTNGDPGWLIRGHFRRKLQEVLFDGRPEADADLAANAKSFFAQIAADRKTLVVPANAQEAAKLGAHYKNAALGDLAVQRSGPKTLFDFGEWRSEVASRRNPDGTTSFITISPGVSGFEFVVGGGAKQTLTLRDAQHEYLFESG